MPLLRSTPYRFASILSWSILLMAIVAAYGYGVCFNSFYVPGNADKTLYHLSNAPHQLSGTIMAFLIIIVLDIIAAWAIYATFGLYRPRLAQLSALFRLVYACLLGTAISYLQSARHQLDAPGAIGAQLLQDINMFIDTWSMALILFGIHLVATALLLLKKGLAPKLIPVLLLLSGICYLSSNTLYMVYAIPYSYRERIDQVMALPLALGEILFALWLLAMGNKRCRSLLRLRDSFANAA